MDNLCTLGGEGINHCVSYLVIRGLLCLKRKGAYCVHKELRLYSLFNIGLGGANCVSEEVGRNLSCKVEIWSHY